MPISKVIILTLLLIVNCEAFSQVEHNFKMEPEKTDCHELELTGDLDKDLELIKSSTFRLKEAMKVSRYHIPNSVEYYSCDGVKGYIIAVENDSTSKLFKDVNKSVWDSLTNSKDPILYYKIKFLNENN